MIESLALADTALQQGRAPRPLPLFLELVRAVAKDEPGVARAALDGLARYGREPRSPQPLPRTAVAQIGGATLRDHGGNGPTVVLVPSLINPPHVLDLPGRSLAEALAAEHRVVLLDWGAARERASLDLGGHVAELLVPLLRQRKEPVDLVGYCLGGTMAIAAANLLPVRSVATLAAPWRFDAYPADSVAGLTNLWRRAGSASARFGVLPTEVLQAAFWSLDPRGIVAKFAALSREPSGSAAVARFVTLEDWANDGEPVPLPAAEELIERLFAANLPGRGDWIVGGVAIDAAPAPSLHFTARGDRIVPQGSAPPGRAHGIAAGHVGMLAGRRTAIDLQRPLLDFLRTTH